MTAAAAVGTVQHPCNRTGRAPSYACFTIKHQTRKFFYFGDLLEPAYRRRMLEGAWLWTAQDPLRRPHHAFQKPGPGWGPDAKNSWVDVRSTENLYLMRVTSVYLFAEAAGNRDVAAKYEDELRRYAKTVYRIGIGEWESDEVHLVTSNYRPPAAVLNLARKRFERPVKPPSPHFSPRRMEHCSVPERTEQCSILRKHALSPFLPAW